MSLFAKSLCRASRQAQPMRTNVRRYATEPAKSGGSNTALIVGGAAVALGGGYWYFTQADPNAAAKATAAVSDAKKSVAPSPTDKKTFVGGEQGFVSLKLESVDNVSHNTKKLRFALPEEDQLSGLNIASALLTKYKGPEMEKPVLRPYTPVSDEDARGYVDLLVKKYPDGAMSTHMHDMEPGQRLDFKGPLPKYPMEANKHKHVTLIAGGTGITPMWQVARYIFSHPDDQTKVTLVFGNVSEEDILLKHEWEELENKYPQRFRAFYVLNNPPERWQGGKGFINKELLKTVLPEPKEENIKIFVCGPPGLYKAISGPKKSPKDQGEIDGILKELGYSKEQVYKF